MDVYVLYILQNYLDFSLENRVNYDEKNWKMIIKQLNDDHMKIHVVNRAQIIDDAINLARSGLLSYEIALGVTSYLNNEVEYIPCAAALSGM